jgi:hypothetical protein
MTVIPDADGSSATTNYLIACSPGKLRSDYQRGDGNATPACIHLPYQHPAPTLHQRPAPLAGTLYSAATRPTRITIGTRQLQTYLQIRRVLAAAFLYGMLRCLSDHHAGREMQGRQRTTCLAALGPNHSVIHMQVFASDIDKVNSPT